MKQSARVSKSKAPAKSKTGKASKPAAPLPKTMKPVECFIRDLSLECFLPPYAHPAKDRQLEFQVSAGVRPLTENLSCVNLAFRTRIHTPQGAPFVIAEMIYEGVFKATCENEAKARTLYVDGSAEIYGEAKEKLLQALAASGVAPPLPATVDFAEMWNKNHASQAS